MIEVTRAAFGLLTPSCCDGKHLSQHFIAVSQVLVGEEEPEDTAMRRFMETIVQTRVIDQVRLPYI